MAAGDGDIPCVFQRLPDRCLPEGIPRGAQWATHERKDHFLPGEGTLCGPLWEALCFIAFPPWPSTHHGQDHVFFSYPPQPPITYKTARHWTVCFGLHCTLPGPTWGTFQALRNCNRKLGNKIEPLNHYLNNYRAGDFGVGDWVWIYRPYLHVKTTASLLTSRNLYCVISKIRDDTTHAQVVVKPENA